MQCEYYYQNSLSDEPLLVNRVFHGFESAFSTVDIRLFMEGSVCTHCERVLPVDAEILEHRRIFSSDHMVRQALI